MFDMFGRLFGFLLAPDTGEGGGETAEETTEESAEETAESSTEESTEETTEEPTGFSNKSKVFSKKEDEGEEEGGEEETFEPAKWQAQTNGTNKSRQDLAKYSTIDELIAEKDRLETIVRNGNVDLSDESVKNELFKKLGAPETPEGYEVDLEQEGLDKELTKEFMQKAHEKNLTKDQFDFALNQATEYTKKVAAEILKNYAGDPDGAEAHAREKWGTKFNERYENFQRALALGDKEFRDWVKTYKIDNNPKMIDFLERIGSYFGEDNVPLGESEGGVMDDETARLKRRYPSMFQ